MFHYVPPRTKDPGRRRLPELLILTAGDHDGFTYVNVTEIAEPALVLTPARARCHAILAGLAFQSLQHLLGGKIVESLDLLRG